MRGMAFKVFLGAAALLLAAAPAFAHGEKATPPAHILNCMGPSGYHAVMEETSCPLGGEKFENLTLGTFSTFGVQLDDMKISYLPLPPPLPVCPSNGFVVAQESYSAEELSKIESIIHTKEYQDLYKAQHASYYLYAQIEKALHADPASYWYPLVVATWEAHHCNAPERYKLYAESAIDAARARLEDLKKSDANYATKPEYWKLNILIANFYRRLGQFDAAAAWLEALDKKIPESVAGGKYANWSLTLLTKAITDGNSSPIQLKDPAE